jgi:hypothetical protein
MEAKRQQVEKADLDMLYDMVPRLGYSFSTAKRRDELST